MSCRTRSEALWFPAKPATRTCCQLTGKDNKSPSHPQPSSPLPAPRVHTMGWVRTGQPQLFSGEHPRAASKVPEAARGSHCSVLLTDTGLVWCSQPDHGPCHAWSITCVEADDTLPMVIVYLLHLNTILKATWPGDPCIHRWVLSMVCSGRPMAKGGSQQGITLCSSISSWISTAPVRILFC